MSTDTFKLEILEQLELLTQKLKETKERTDSLGASKIEAGQAQSIEDISHGASVALTNLTGLVAAVESGSIEDCVERGSELYEHTERHIVRKAIIDDLHECLNEAEEEAASRTAKQRKSYKTFIETGRMMLAELQVLAELTRYIRDRIDAHAAGSRKKATTMAHDDETNGVEEALHSIGRQLSFLGTSQGGRSTAGIEGPGRFRSTADQLAASLDALGLPHHGIQFAMGNGVDNARDDLIEGLLDIYHPVERDGITVFEPGRTDGRDTPKLPADALLGGASKVAARLVRAEADNILDVLDRLPDKTRFRSRPGTTSPKQLRDTVAKRFENLDEVMADPLGVNLPRATFTVRRVGKAILDFFKYANLEHELHAQMRERQLSTAFFGGFDELDPVDEDKIGTGRTAIESEEIRREIAELADSFKRLNERIHVPVSNIRGRSGARLEQSLSAAHRSALDLSDILVRSGSNLPEQDLHIFMIDLRAEIAQPSAVSKEDDSKVELSTGQLLDWIIDTARPYVAANLHAGVLESRDFAILVDELKGQSQALDALSRSAKRLDFAIRLPGPMRQLEELHFHVAEAAIHAGKLTADAA